jgi:hypothetical protein
MWMKAVIMAIAPFQSVSSTAYKKLKPSRNIPYSVYKICGNENTGSYYETGKQNVDRENRIAVIKF